jgi:hypothetical protein
VILPHCAHGSQQNGADAGRTADAATIACWLRRHFGVPGHAVELRAIRKDGGVTAGFYDGEHLDAMAAEAVRLTSDPAFKGVYVTLNPLRAEVLGRAGLANQVRGVGTGDSASAADVAARRWLLIDIDPKRPPGCSATDAEKAVARARAVRVRDHLAARGWPPPLLCDSGNGAHLLYRVDLAAEDHGLLKRALRALADRFDDAEADIDRKVHDPARITRLYGTVARKGDDTPDRPHRRTGIVEEPAELKVVPAGLLEALAAETQDETGRERVVQEQSDPWNGIRKLQTGEKVARARAYVGKLPPAVEGHGGDSRTFAVACYLVKDFGLTAEEALPLLLEYNQHCVPPWTEDELRYKLRKAVEGPGERGRLLADRQRAGLHPEPETPGPVSAGGPSPAVPFLGGVPDFILEDLLNSRPRVPRRRRGRRPTWPGITWVIRAEVIRQRRATVYLPDVLLAQVVWGNHQRPRNWRRRLAGWLRRSADQWNRTQANERHSVTECRACHPGCPLHGRPDAPHRHFVFRVARPSPGAIPYNGNFLGCFLGGLEAFRSEEGGEAVFDFSAPRGNPAMPAETAGLWAQEAKKAGRLGAVYLPSLLFGLSARSGLTHEGRCILFALTRETTRAKSSSRPDRALVVTGGQSYSRGTNRVSPCPLLEKGVRYVAFTGNAGYRRRRLWGRGYHLVGKTGGGWLSRAGFVVPQDEDGKWQAVRRFLAELKTLSGPFGLVAAGWHPDRRQWRSLDDLIALAGTPAGRAWLAACRLRVFTREDYLARWRRHFADKLGFSHIPGGGDENEAGPPGQAAGEVVRSAADLTCWMRRRGLTDRALAARLGVSASLVSRFRSGRRKWTAAFQARVAEVIALDAPRYSATHLNSARVNT